MRKSTSWAWAVVACVGVGGVFAFDEKPNRAPVIAPAPKEKFADEAWLPKGVDTAEKNGKYTATANIPPSAFPNLCIPETGPRDWEKRDAAFEKMCPRLFGKMALKIEPTDDTLRKLLKARLHQGILEYHESQKVRRIAGPDPLRLSLEINCLSDLQAVATELWAGQPKELVPWLEELLIAAKEKERHTFLRMEVGALRPDDLYAVSRSRLKVEAELWKAKNPK